MALKSKKLKIPLQSITLPTELPEEVVELFPYNILMCIELNHGFEVALQMFKMYCRLQADVERNKLYCCV